MTAGDASEDGASVVAGLEAFSLYLTMSRTGSQMQEDAAAGMSKPMYRRRGNPPRVGRAPWELTHEQDIHSVWE